jgi:hypothetical protein
MNEVYFISVEIKNPKKKPRGQSPPAIKKLKND